MHTFRLQSGRAGSFRPNPPVTGTAHAVTTSRSTTITRIDSRPASTASARSASAQPPFLTVRHRMPLDSTRPRLCPPSPTCCACCAGRPARVAGAHHQRCAFSDVLACSQPERALVSPRAGRPLRPTAHRARALRRTSTVDARARTGARAGRLAGSPRAAAGGGRASAYVFPCCSLLWLPRVTLHSLSHRDWSASGTATLAWRPHYSLSACPAAAERSTQARIGQPHEVARDGDAAVFFVAGAARLSWHCSCAAGWVFFCRAWPESACATG